ncbi:MAG: alkaline phosphatase family protein [Ignavibacteria bacterium]|nr:alkaline phosphatase family protein [Ignavibacteria bacterium]
MLRLVIFILLLILTSISMSAGKPKLIVVISYDQMRGDYPDKWQSIWGKKGFNRVRKDGINFSQCYFDHATNMTCPGHAVLLTGCYPVKTGIVSNDFYDKSLGKMCYCTSDSLYPVGGDYKKGRSPLLMKMPTLGDYLIEKYPKSKVMGIGLKDRSGIVMSGKKAQTVLWFDEETAELSTSTYYKSPQWLGKWNRKNSLHKFIGKVWNTSIPDSISVIDSVHWEGKYPGGSKIFPHKIPVDLNDKMCVEAFLVSPFSIEYLFAAVREMITREDLGKDNSPDILNIAVSTTDYVGHIFGPDSREVQELYVHADRYLGEFIEFLDNKLGRDKYLLVITSDHGVGPIPEVVREIGLEKLDAGRLSKAKLRSDMNNYLHKFLPIGIQENLIERVELPSVFINHQVLDKYKIDEEILLDSLVDFTLRIEGMKLAASTNKLKKSKPELWDDDIWRMVKNDIFSARTGDMICYPKPYWIFGANPATHGTPYDYDRYVPFMLMGNSISRNEFLYKVTPADIAPTLGNILGIKMVDIDGQILQLK